MFDRVLQRNAAATGSRFSAPSRRPEKPAPSPTAEEPVEPVAPEAEADPAEDANYIALKVELHQKLLEVMNLQALDKMPPEQFRREFGELVRDLLTREKVPLNQQERGKLVDDILDELLGLGPIEPLLKDVSVSDILVNTWRQVYV